MALRLIAFFSFIPLFAAAAIMLASEANDMSYNPATSKI
jgi:hypothetical protein